MEIDSEHFIYAGFVENIDEYTQSADIVLNPVLSGGGIKTKIVEALGFNKNVVSTQTGAIGVDATICGSKLYIVNDYDWDSFVDKIIEAVDDTSTIPSQFFNVFSWKSVAQVIINNLTH
jgi:glycosyltransferase involved in cell wall biosynthesis